MEYKTPLRSQNKIYLVPLAVVVVVAVLGFEVATKFAPKLQVLNPDKPASASAIIPVAIPDTSYPIPSSGAYYVAPSGNDNNSGTSVSSPWQTLGHAISTAPAGATIIMRAGTYREGNLPDKNKALTIQPYPHEQVWFDGSTPVTGWVVDSSGVWREDGWTTKFCADSSGTQTPTYCTTTDSSGNPVLGDPQHPDSWRPDQLFYDGQPKAQVASKAAIGPGTFFVDYANNQIFTGDNPAGHTVEASQYQYLFKFLAAGDSGTVVRGVGVWKYASDTAGAKKPDGSFMVPAQILANVTNLTFENDTFAYSASSGLAIQNGADTVRGSLFIDNMNQGMSGYIANGSLVEKSTFAYNNQGGFCGCSGAYDQAAGSKIFQTDSITIRDNIFDGNLANGWWCDGNCTNAVVVRNVARNNHGNGLYYEISNGAIMASNLSYNNSSNGILVKSANVRVYNNTTWGNNQDIAIVDDSRVPGPAGYSTRANEVVNNLVANSNGASKNYISQPPALLDVNDTNSPDGTVPSGMVTNLDYNYYYRLSSSAPARLIGWNGGSITTSYNDLASFVADSTNNPSHYEAHGRLFDNQSDPLFTDSAGENFQLRCGTAAIGAGTALPSDIAAALGVATSPVNIGAISWPGASQPPTAASCSAASTRHPDGTLIKQAGSPTVYLVSNGALSVIPSANIFIANHLDWTRLKPAVSGDLALPTGQSIGYQAGALLKGSSSSIYVTDVSGGAVRKRHITSSLAFQQLGYTMSDILPVSDTDLPPVDGPDLYLGDHHPDGTVVRYPDQSVFLINNSTRLYIPSMLIFVSNGYSTQSIKPAVGGDSGLPQAANLTPREGSLVKGSSSTVYVIDMNGSTLTKRAISSIQVFSYLGYTASDIFTIPDDQLPSVDGPAVN